MTPGDPYLTRELDDLRSRQRAARPIVVEVQRRQASLGSTTWSYPAGKFEQLDQSERRELEVRRLAEEEFEPLRDWHRSVAAYIAHQRVLETLRAGDNNIWDTVGARLAAREPDVLDPPELDGSGNAFWNRLHTVSALWALADMLADAGSR